MGSGNGVDKSLDLRLIPEFEGSPQQSVVELLEKVELVCKLRDISDVASVIPLRLTGGAFAVYLQLNAQERSSIDKVKESLLAAFAADPFVAYDQFVSRKLGPHESHDVFLAELRRLATAQGPGVRSPTAPPGQRCFECGGPNHFARDCLARRQDGDPEKRARDRGISASLLSPRPLTEALPAVRMNVGGIRRRVLVDTWCSVCVAHASCCRSWREEDVAITTMCGQAMKCEGTGVVQLRPHGKPLGYDLILGMNGIAALGGVTVTGGRCVRFGLDDPGVCAAAEAGISIRERDFTATYCPSTRSWTAAWKWSMMDFRELNAHIESHTADADLCSQKLREWRRQGVNVALIDLKKAYLQIRIDKSLWPYQTVVFKDKGYCLTRLGIDLNVAPLVMKAVLNCVLSWDPDVRKGTSAYIDDILVNESVVAVDRVKRHLPHYGLTCKNHERAADGARLLGLKVWGERGKLMWRRDNDVDEFKQQGVNVALIDLKKAYLQIRIDKSLWPYQTVVFNGKRYCLTRLGFGLNVAPLVMKAVLNCASL
ncbi:hypothetical protein T09_12756 [Trichinella sp. T9]|nr:hypothetical protein T09_12756 [Trichinella sp. T9]